LAAADRTGAAIVIIASSPFPGPESRDVGPRLPLDVALSSPLGVGVLCYAADRRPAVSILQRNGGAFPRRRKASSVSEMDRVAVRTQATRGALSALAGLTEQTSDPIWWAATLPVNNASMGIGRCAADASQRHKKAQSIKKREKIRPSDPINSTKTERFFTCCGGSCALQSASRPTRRRQVLRYD